jgi:hypothetical protein
VDTKPAWIIRQEIPVVQKEEVGVVDGQKGKKVTGIGGGIKDDFAGDPAFSEQLRGGNFADPDKLGHGHFTIHLGDSKGYGLFPYRLFERF